MSIIFNRWPIYIVDIDIFPSSFILIWDLRGQGRGGGGLGTGAWGQEGGPDGMVSPGYKWNLLPYAPSITCPTNLFIHAKFCDVSSLQALVAHFGRRAFGLLFVVEFGLEDTKVKAFWQWPFVHKTVPCCESGQLSCVILSKFVHDLGPNVHIYP